MQLKLVGAQRYVDVRISEEVIQHGAVVDVADDIAESLLEEVTYDSLNNANPLFIEVTPEPTKKVTEKATVEEADDVEDAPSEPRARRAPAKSKKA
jgi:hypothetical protein